MTGPREPLYSPLVVALGTALAAAAVVLLLFMLQVTIGPFDLFGLPEQPNQGRDSPVEMHILGPHGDGPSGLHTRAEWIGPSRVELRVTNAAPDVLEGGIVRLELPASLELRAIWPTRLRQPPAKAREGPASDGVARRIELMLPPIPGQSTSTYHLDVEESAP